MSGRFLSYVDYIHKTKLSRGADPTSLEAQKYNAMESLAKLAHDQMATALSQKTYQCHYNLMHRILMRIYVIVWPS